MKFDNLREVAAALVCEVEWIDFPVLGMDRKHFEAFVASKQFRPAVAGVCGRAIDSLDITKFPVPASHEVDDVAAGIVQAAIKAALIVTTKNTIYRAGLLQVKFRRWPLPTMQAPRGVAVASIREQNAERDKHAGN